MTNEELIAGYLSDTLTVYERKQLLDALSNDTELQQRFETELHIHAGLQLDAQRITEKSSLLTDAIIGDLTDTPASQQERTRTFPHVLTWLAVASLCLVTGAYLFQQSNDHIPTIQHSAKGITLDAKGTQLLTSTKLPSNTTLHLDTEQVVNLEYADRSLLSLSGPARWSFPEQSTGKHVHIYNGIFEGDVTRQDEAPMQLTGPHSQLTVLGTSFKYSCSPAGDLLSVYHGSVRMKDTTGHNWTVQTGEHAYINEFGQLVPLGEMPQHALLQATKTSVMHCTATNPNWLTAYHTQNQHRTVHKLGETGLSFIRIARPYSPTNNWFSASFHNGQPERIKQNESIPLFTITSNSYLHVTLRNTYQLKAIGLTLWTKKHSIGSRVPLIIDTKWHTFSLPIDAMGTADSESYVGEEVMGFRLFATQDRQASQSGADLGFDVLSVWVTE